MKKKVFLSILALLIGFTITYGQITGSTSYDFKDGTLITNGQSDDGSLVLSGTYSHHGSTYGLDMKAESAIKIAVSGNSTIKFLGSKHSSLKMIASTSSGADLGTHVTKLGTDLTDTYDFVYAGPADTLTFAATGDGSDIYLPSLEVIPAQDGSTATAAEKNIIYQFDLRDGSIIPNDEGLNGNYTIEKGLFKVESGSSNAYGYNGDKHGSILKAGNKITLQVGGNSTIKIGGCTYSNGTVAASSTSGNFDKDSQASQASGEYHNDGTTIDFLYAGTAGLIELDFTGTTYIPIIEIVPVPFEVELTQWVQKTGIVSLNGIDISYTAGASSTETPTVSVTEGQVNSATTETAIILMDLAGMPIDSYTSQVSGDIESVIVSGDTLKLTLTDAASNPTGYNLIVLDNSQTIEAEAGKTYTYNLGDGSVMPKNTEIFYSTFSTTDGIVTIKSNDGDEFWYHDSSHGAVIYDGNSFEILVAGNATLTFSTCAYSADNAVFVISDENSTELGTIAAENNGGDDAFAVNFSYSGAAGVLTATLVADGAVYIHGLTIENAAAIEPSNGLTDVWDFGAEQLDAEIYNNNITEAIVNSWYDASITAGSSGNVFPSFSAGVLSWIGGGNDRLRTTNTNLTRYDENISGVEGYTGRIYVNSGSNTSRYMSLALSEDDEVTVMALSQNGGGQLNFEYVENPEAQTDVAAILSDLTEVKFVAKAAGTYHIFDTQDKPSYYRIYRKDAKYATLTGNVDVSAAEGISESYAIVFTNEAGKTWRAAVSGGAYSLDLPVGFNYELSLSDADKYIINSGTSLVLADETSSFDVTIQEVALFTVSGSITGLVDDKTNLEIVYTPDPSANKIYNPLALIDTDAATYTVQLEPNCEYTISAKGVNDFYIPENKITIGEADVTAEVVFEAKPTYAVAIEATGLNDEQLAKLELTFTNLNEEGYAYSFSSIDGITLRDGTYAISKGGLNEYAVEMGLTSNLKIAGEAATKTLAFNSISNWTFDDIVIESGTETYKGLLFTGSIKNEIAKGHLVTKPEATIQVPANAGDKITVTYYYAADFSFEGGEAIVTSSGSTSTLETADYTYTGTDAGYVTITIGASAGTTYLTNISVEAIVEYQAEISVGVDKDYQSIKEALAAIRKMVRNNNERVVVMIDPGNYEEMLMINMPDVTLKNAASTPSIALANGGVDIDASAVRITSYYGHGYNYYSMDNQKWNAEVLRVNKENGYLTAENGGGVSSNGSYWNATVVVSANGFQADNIIFENSFNQYISKKESEDVVVMWESGSKGERPTDVGNTAVQASGFVERAAAIAIANNTDKTILNQCRVVGNQDSFFGGTNSRVVVYKGAMMGGTDYLFGPMVAVFYKTDLVINTSKTSWYITAAQQSSGRGYLMYECNIRSATPGLENTFSQKVAPGHFGRPWRATSSEVVFYNTTIETTDYSGSEGKSLILPEGWNSSLGGESAFMYEYGTTEKSGENNKNSRASWSTVLTEPTLTDGTEINTFNFTKGSDDWDPIPALIAGDEIPKKEFLVDNLVFGTVDSPEDYSCILNINWDEKNVNLILNISDDSIVTTGTINQVDNVEVYFDMDNSKNIKWPRNGGWISADPTYDNNDYQFRLVPGAEFSANNTLGGVTQVYSITETGYKFDLTIPWDSLMEGFVPAIGTQIGFDILSSDNDATASDANRNQLTLVSSTPNPYNDPSLFGTLQFDAMGEFSLIPDVEKPGIASNLTATADKKNVTLAWENASDNIAILYYNVYQNDELLSDIVYPKQSDNTLTVTVPEDGDYTFSLETVDNSGNVSESKESVAINVTTVSVHDLSSTISVYPNPVLDVLNITGMNNIRRIEVLGITGNVIKAFEGQSTINVATLSKGTYVLKAQNDNNVVTTRFIKK